MELLATPQSRGAQGWNVSFDIRFGEDRTLHLCTEVCRDEAHMGERLQEIRSTLKHFLFIGSWTNQEVYIKGDYGD